MLMNAAGLTNVPPLQLDIGLTKRDTRWHCERSYQMRLAGGAAELFFIDTNPFIASYHNVSWANQLGPSLLTLALALNFDPP